MKMGLPYDSEDARQVASAISAIMTAYAYITSSQIASLKGPFPKFKMNREPMLDVIKLHRKHAYKLNGKSYLAKTAKRYWDEALKMGQKYGYRNAQTTCIAPTGTIGLLMDCDTTGIEPDFALVKVKKLVGGGYFKIVNNAVADALTHLGYSGKQVDDIIKYICGTNSLKDAPHINHPTLKEKGFDGETIKKVEETLPRVFQLKQAFSKNVIGEEKLKSMNFTPQQYNNPDFDLLTSLGFSDRQIEEAGNHACGRMTIEGAPHLKKEHLPVFDCASRCGPYGQRFIHWIGHIKMLSAVQPLISGGISKTVNMPNEVSTEDIKDTYLKAWKMGLKVIAIYRDGCKATQPLTVAREKKLIVDFKKQLKLFELQYTPRRRKLPKERKGTTIEAKVAGNKVYLRTGEYEDGTLGEIFIDMHKEGASFRSLLNCFAIAVSFGLQYGVPLEEFIDTFTFTRFEPYGPVDHEEVKFCTSVIDYIFRVLAIKYLGRTDLAHVTVKKQTDISPPKSETPSKTTPRTFLNNYISQISPDSPICNTCGHLMERTGTCYRCVNCGSQLGCG
jgi:ribonucleoside-diphosphate reductase alpha chain